MILAKILLLFSLTLSPLLLQAGDFQSFVMVQLCAKNDSCQNPSTLLKNALMMCDLSLKSGHCDEVRKQFPEASALFRKCDVKSYCEQSLAYQLDNQKACLKGYGNAMRDLGISLKEMGLAAGHKIEKTWDDFDASQTAKALTYAIDRSWEKFKNHGGATSAKDRERQAEKLNIMLRAVQEKIVSTEMKYSCYTPIAQAELSCYALGTVVDPTMVLGYAVKLARGAKVAAEIARLADAKILTSEVRAVATTGSDAVRGLGAINRAQFVKQYLYYSPTTVAQNEKWIHLAETTKSSGKVKFVNFENAEMQNLNNTLQDKNLVTSLTNYHKEVIFNKVEALKKEFPGVQVEVYSDYKSARFAFKGQAPPDFQQRVAKAFADANEDFKTNLIDTKIIRATEAPSPDQWIRAGAGDTADQANFATRYSRKLEQNQLQNFSDSEVQSHMNLTFTDVEKLRTKISSELPGSSSMISGKTLDADVFNIVKKGAGDTPAIQKALGQRFSLKVSEATVTDIQKYISKVDEFSPDLYIKKREVATLVDADLGGISADMAGMGAQNIKSTADALAKSKTTDQVLAQARLAEKKVTENFNSQKGGFQDVVSKAVGPDRMKTVCSGDDCTSIAKVALTENDKAKILQGLADEGYSSKFRLSFIPEGISDKAARTNLATHGESIEKLTQKHLAAEIPPETLKGLIFGVDMQTTQINQGPVKLIIGSSKEVQLTVAEKAKIQKSFEKAVQQMNDELILQHEKAAYQALH